MNIAIVGYGLEGKSSCEYFLARGDRVTVCDQDSSVVDSIPKGVITKVGAGYLDDLDRFDRIVRSAGIPPEVILDRYPSMAERITTNINEFLLRSPSKNIIGITGTKGKGTTSTLTARILEMGGKEVFLGGNIGVPALSFLKDMQPDNWVVLELSSFQLVDVHRAPHIAVCLMVAPEHLDWHGSRQAYYRAKSRLFELQKSKDIAIYFSKSIASHTIASHSLGTKLTYYDSPGAYVENGAIMIDGQTICQTDELQLRGRHNWQNVCAAVTAAWQAGVQDIEAIRSAVLSFSGLEHRLEYVAEINGVEYFDDSFGTTPETGIVAIESFKQPKVLILGGSDKGAHYKKLAKTVMREAVRHVITIGDTGPAIAEALRNEGFVELSPGGTTMPDIVSAAQMVAAPGDVVLLSPACASFGLFHDYKDRGTQFKQAVQGLALVAE